MSIDLVGPDGAEYTLNNDDPAALNEALRQGFKLPLNSAPKSDLEQAGESLVAGTAGAVEGLTGGVLGSALGLAARPDKYGFRDPTKLATAKEVHRLQEEHPVASGVGEFAGVVASPLNEVTNLVRAPIGATTALGKIGATALGGAASGALFGAGKTVSDAMLGDSDLTAEKLIAGAGLGALLGGAGGGIGAGIEEGVAAAAPAIKGALSKSSAAMARRTSSVLDDIANDATISATRAQQNVINKIGDDKVIAAARAIRERGHLELTPDKMAESISKDREGLGKVLGKFLDDADAAGARPDHMRMLNRLDAFESGLNDIEKGVIAKDLSDARRAVAKLGEEGAGFRKLDDLKKTIQERAKFSKGPTPLDDTSMALKRGLAGTFRDELDQQLLPQLGSDAAKAFTDSKALYGSLKDAERLAQSGAGRVNPLFGLRDVLWGAAGASAHPFGIAAALGSKVMREYGPAIIARIADRLAESPALQATAKSFAGALPSKLPQLGDYGAMLTKQLERGPTFAMAAHMAMAQLDPGYAAHAQLAGLEPETPEEAPYVLGRAQTLAEAQAALKAQDAEIHRGIDRVFKGDSSPAAPQAFKSQDFGSMRMRRGSTDAFDKRADEARQLATNPEALIDRVTANMAGVGGAAPAVTASMTQLATRAVNYLAKASMVPPKAGPLAQDWRVSDAQRFSFAQKLEVVQEPMSVLKHAASGTLCPEQMEALRAVYPKLAKQISDAALERMVSAKGSVPYKSRVMLWMLSGVDPDGSFSPQAIAANQTAISSASKGQPGAPGAPDGKQDVGNFKVAERMATPGQRREVRNDES